MSNEINGEMLIRAEREYKKKTEIMSDILGEIAWIIEEERHRIEEEEGPLVAKAVTQMHVTRNIPVLIHGIYKDKSYEILEQIKNNIDILEKERKKR